MPYLWTVLYFLLILVIFVALAIVCDDFFVPSLEAISEKLELSEDVAGATFMAAGSSAPELFTSVAGVSVESDVGVGTIVGSAVFNILIIVALSAALAGQVLNLDWRPMFRDSLFYAISIVAFIYFVWDGVIRWYEALSLFLLYVLYIILMKLNVRFMALLDKCCGKVSVLPVKPDEVITTAGGAMAPSGTVVNVGDTIQMDGAGGGRGAPSSSYGPYPLISANSVNRPMPERRSSRALQRRLSNMSLTSDDGQKHIFHHIKHGELSHHFA